MAFGHYTKIIYSGYAFLHMFFLYVVFRITGKQYQAMVDMPAILSILFFMLDMLIFVSLLYLLEKHKKAANLGLSKYIGIAAVMVGIFSVEAHLLDEAYYSNLLFITFLSLFICTVIHVVFSKNADVGKTANICKQLFIISMLAALFWDASVWNHVDSMGSVNRAAMVFGLLIWNISAICLGARIYCINKGRMLAECRLFLRKNRCLFLLLFLVCILYIPCFSYWFKSDSNVYYTDMVMKQGGWDFTVGSALSSFMLGGHLCYGYSFFLAIGQSLFPNHGIGIRLVLLLLYLVTIFLFSKILEKLLPSMGKLENILVTGVFVFTPIVFGILFEANIDFPLLCFWTWFMYCHVTGKQILRLFAGVLTCFSKEIGVLFVVGFFISNYIYDLIYRNRKLPVSQITEKMFQAMNLSDFFTCFSSAFLFLICSIFAKGGWASNAVTAPKGTEGMLENTIQFSLPYILIKLKQIFILNFQWLFTMIAIVFFIYLFSKKIKLCITQMGFTLTMLFGGFLCFNFFYFTWPMQGIYR